MQTKVYEIQTVENGYVYTFISRGKRDVVKVVRYNKLLNIYHSESGKMITAYNLGFGNSKNDRFEIDDQVRSNNGDMYVVFNTVLHTIPLFLSKVGFAAICVRGSDEIRHLAYHRFVERNISRLKLEYELYGLLNDFIEPYINGQRYTYIAILPKKIYI
ncbi:MAG: hypothetical protein AAGA77_07845 [Bacteroidota bacterium]